MIGTSFATTTTLAATSSSGASGVDKTIVVKLVKEAVGSGSTDISLDAG